VEGGEEGVHLGDAACARLGSGLAAAEALVFERTAGAEGGTGATNSRILSPAAIAPKVVSRMLPRMVGEQLRLALAVEWIGAALARGDLLGLAPRGGQPLSLGSIGQRPGRPCGRGEQLAGLGGELDSGQRPSMMEGRQAAGHLPTKGTGMDSGIAIIEGIY